MNKSPIRSKLVAPEQLVGLLVFDDSMNFYVLRVIFLALHFIFHCCNK